MNLYEVNVKLYEEDFEEEEESNNESDENEEGEFREISIFFHVLADCLSCAFLEADRYLSPKLEDVNYEVVSIIKQENLRIVNFPNESNEELQFRCAYCKKDIILPGNEWSEMECPECGSRILRDRVITLQNGQLLMISTKEDNKDDPNAKS